MNPVERNEGMTLNGQFVFFDFVSLPSDRLTDLLAFGLPDFWQKIKTDSQGESSVK